MSPIMMKLEQAEQDQDLELKFELDYQLTLTTAQRFEMMLHKSRELAEELLKRGYREPAQVVKRS